MLYDTFCNLETLGICRRGYFIEGLGGAQFALPGAVERLRAPRDGEGGGPLGLAAARPAQPLRARPRPALRRRAAMAGAGRRLGGRGPPPRTGRRRARRARG